MSDKTEPFCALCGRRENQVRGLKAHGRAYICEDCDSLQMKGATEAAIMRVRDDSVNDKYQRHKVELATQAQLRSAFHTPVAPPKDPDSQRPTGDQMSNGFMAHPILQDKVQFNGVNENMKLPNMDPEQWENYLQNQLDYKNEKRLEKQNQQTMRPTP